VSLDVVVRPSTPPNLALSQPSLSLSGLPRSWLQLALTVDRLVNLCAVPILRFMMSKRDQETQSISEEPRPPSSRLFQTTTVRAPLPA
jgi:hypothetical protein